MLQAEPTLTIKEMAERSTMSTHAMSQLVCKDLKLKRKCPKFIPQELSEPQKWTRMTVSQDNIDLVCSQQDPEAFLRTIITGDETWVSTHEMVRKSKSLAWVGPEDGRPKKPMKSLFAKKTMMTLFFYCAGVVHIEFLEKGEKVTSARYCRTLANLKESIRKKRPLLWPDRSFLLHHDNASPHTALPTVQKMDKWGLKTLPHPPYSPDLAPCDFSIFPKFKEHLRGRTFQNLAQLQQESRKILLSMPTEVFSNAIHDMVLRWQKCVSVNGEYFEGDSVSVDPLFEQISGSEDSSSSDEA